MNTSSVTLGPVTVTPIAGYDENHPLRPAVDLVTYTPKGEPRGSTTRGSEVAESEVSWSGMPHGAARFVLKHTAVEMLDGSGHEPGMTVDIKLGSLLVS